MAVTEALTRRWSQYWPVAATCLLITHAIAHTVIQARLGGPSIVAFRVAPPLIFVATAVTLAMAARDLFHGGWRRILRGAATFPLLALVASSFLSLFTYRVYPSSHDERSPAWCLGLPLGDDIAVLEGGRALDTNTHAGSPSQRYAYDLTTTRRNTLHDDNGIELAEYYGYGQPVRAPVSGTAVSVVADQPDLAPDTPWWPWRPVLGNHVVLNIDDTALYLVLAHLQRDSITVRAGDHVGIGSHVGRVGNSGRSGTPRLHLHVQDGPWDSGVEGVPVPFCGYEVIDRGASWDAAHSVTDGIPTGRDRQQVIRLKRVE